MTWAFGFELTNPDIWHEEVGAVIRARLTSARWPLLAPQRPLRLADPQPLCRHERRRVGITLSNADCYFMQLGTSTTSSLDTGTPQLQVLAGGQVDGTSLGIPNQGGDDSLPATFCAADPWRI